MQCRVKFVPVIAENDSDAKGRQVSIATTTANLTVSFVVKWPHEIYLQGALRSMPGRKDFSYREAFKAIFVRFIAHGAELHLFHLCLLKVEEAKKGS